MGHIYLSIIWNPLYQMLYDDLMVQKFYDEKFCNLGRCDLDEMFFVFLVKDQPKFLARFDHLNNEQNNYNDH